MKFPFHIDGLEYYSTVLWHLKDDITLATLAHQLTDIDRKHPAVNILRGIKNESVYFVCIELVCIWELFKFKS